MPSIDLHLWVLIASEEVQNYGKNCIPVHQKNFENGSWEGRGKSGYMERLSSQENWLVVKRQLFAAMISPTTHIIHNKSDDLNFSTLVTRKGFVRPISPDKFSLRRVIRTTHMGAMIWVY